MPTVDASVGTTTANSYVTVAEANSYFEGAYGRSLWTTAILSVKEQLVITASRVLDQFMDWSGHPTNPDQSMSWPRKLIYSQFGLEYPTDSVVNKVKMATYELAYYILENQGISFEPQSVDRVKVGPVEIEFSASSVNLGIPKFIEDMVRGLGSPILVDRASARNVSLDRV